MDVWPPVDANRALKFDANNQIISIIGDDFERLGNVEKWCNGAVASDGASSPLSQNKSSELIYFRSL
jgi:hypothetical protein